MYITLVRELVNRISHTVIGHLLYLTYTILVTYYITISNETCYQNYSYLEFNNFS